MWGTGHGRSMGALTSSTVVKTEFRVLLVWAAKCWWPAVTSSGVESQAAEAEDCKAANVST
jgi:hypothetical protein